VRLMLFLLAVSCGLHTTTSYSWSNDDNGSSPRSSSSSESGGTFLVPASSIREHYDRRMSWWLAFAANGMVEIVTELPSALRPELRACIGDVESEIGRTRNIVTPFPLMEGPSERVSTKLRTTALLFTLYYRTPLNWKLQILALANYS
jgi:hypothetical protein